MHNTDKPDQLFRQAFGCAPDALFYAPGRVNLIGEHTDYNGGHVFPCALNLGTYGAVHKRGDRIIRLVSGNISLSVCVSIDNLINDPTHGWANYSKGVVSEIIKLGYDIGGFDIAVWGDIPNSAGLSSSASLEMLTAVAINHLYNLDIPAKELALLSQRAENLFVGVNCGIMDQYAVAMGRKGFALLLNCQQLLHEYVPFDLNEYVIVIANTNKPRGLADSKYHERQHECQAAFNILKQTCPNIQSLCDLDTETFEKHKHTIQNATVRNRAEHAVYENARTLAAVDKLTAGDLHSFGQLMNESHVSLRDLYEVTGTELDALAEAAWQAEGVIGSRMTGAGFGGCTVSIIRKNAVEDFIQSVGSKYTSRTGLTADFYTAETANGACAL